MEQTVQSQSAARSGRPGAAEDLALVEACAQGVPEAFKELLSRHRRSALTLAFQMLGDAEDAEDVAQEAFVRVFQAIPQFRRQASFSTWLYRIVTNLCLGRRRRRRPVMELETMAEPASEENPARQVTEGLLARQVLDELPAPLRAALVLREQEGLSYAEIATALGVPVGTVRSRLSKARMAFRNRWKELAEGSES
jgi:RNA polymerase sigma-70 factor (ECF subfamily)